MPDLTTKKGGILATVSLRGIQKSFKDTRILRGIDLDIGAGEFVSLVGPSGCGKSTLLRIIAGLEEPTAGDVLIGGASVAGMRAADRNLSMVFQSYALYPHLTVAENIAVPLRMRRLNRWQRLPLVGGLIGGALQRSIVADVARAAEMLEITPLLDRRPGQLSGGQRQRVALGRALVRNPAAFLLDEPLSNLDAKLRAHTRTEITELHRKLGATFIYVTHDQVEAMTMSDRIAVMMGGQILQCDTPARIYADPCDLRVAEFVGSPRINVIPAEADSEGRIAIPGCALPLRHTGRAALRLALRPEALFLTEHEPKLRGIVAHVENMGHEFVIQIAVQGLPARLVLRAAVPVAVGQAVGVGFDAAQALLFDADGARCRDVAHQARVAA